MASARQVWTALCLSTAVMAWTAQPAFAQRQGGAVQQRQNPQPNGDAQPSLALEAHVRGVRDDAMQSRALAIEVLDLKVRIRGSIAETEMTATFKNASNDVLEGDFHFDMPRGSVVTGYALDVGGTMIDGVLAGRDQAREAYQRRVVQRIDPGLAEVGWSDRFSTRIFPIPAQGSRTIRLVMTSPIDPATGYVLPMRPTGRIGRLTMAIQSDDGTPPQARLPGGISGQWQAGRLRVDQWDARLSGDLVLPQVARSTPAQLSRHANGQLFFDIEDSAPRQPVGAGARPRVHILWDRSVSRSDDHLADERALVLEWVRRNNADVAGLTLFDSGGVQTMAVANAAALERQLSAVHYGGGTSFAALNGIGGGTGDICLLVSDGRSTIDSRVDFAPGCRVFAIASDREVDRGWLGDLAQRTGGAFVELGSVAREQALDMLSPAARDVGVLVDARGAPVNAVRLPSADGKFRFVGPVPEQGGLRLMHAGAVARDYALNRDAAVSFSGPGAIWASRRIAANGDEMTTAERVDLSRRYSVASPLVSFIVLEMPNDYVEANIPPPASYPKPLMEQFTQLRASADAATAQRQQQRLASVEQLWRQQVEWWNQQFDPNAKNPAEAPPEPSPVQRQERGNRGQNNSGRAAPIR